MEKLQISVYRCVYIVGACIARPAILVQNCITTGDKSLFSFGKSKKCSIFWRATNGRPYGILGTLNTNLKQRYSAMRPQAMSRHTVRNTVMPEQRVVQTTNWVASCSSLCIPLAMMALETATGEPKRATRAG